ncbi:non-ribosomal peptide synthetase [Vibrio nitrifigilis]|uniref:Amino acid adenylation domain-containing protein n=1 Tax=Vibrio nitrifigilis TaxID=2789781 RepID=A0ABS0GDC1_9VIBR|nr:non-ribosomal peptide synthetase [Vibrio nitrifigilis]MBF9000412.1 amino acid adenylation domain-containing protein [Vibrio nitrifigilis]
MFDNDSPQETKSSPSFQSLPLSSAQQGIWFAQQVNPDAASHVFKIAEYFDINGVVDTSALEQAIRQTVSEAQAYQVTIHEVEDECFQTCSLHPDWHLPILDMSGDESPFTSALEWMQRDIDTPMDLSSGPLFSFAIIKLDSSRTCLYQCVHHIINDGLGGHLFIDRVLSLYNAAIDNTQSAGHATFGTLQEVQQAELHYLESERFSKDKDFWVNKYQQRANSVSLSGKTAACLSVYRYQNYLSTKLTSQLRDLASRYHVTLPQLLVSLLGGYLYRMTGQESMLVGFPVSGRRNKALRSTPTMAVNVVPVELNFSPETTLEQSLSAIKRDLFGALKHQDYRSEALKAELGLFNEQHPLFSTLINIVPFKEQIAFGQAPATVHNLSTGPTDDLSITLYERGLDGGLELSLAANTALYSDDEVDAHGKRMVHFLAAAVANANGNIHQLDIALPSEKQSILQHFNDTKTPFSAQSGLHELIEQQVNFHPNAPALDFNGAVMSYAQLNQKANQLAHWLQDHGVQATDRVAISLPRNCELIVAVLATLKVGATYVPMDPNYPLERRLYMVKDCQPKVILTLSSSDLFTQSFSSATLVVDFEEALQESQSLSNGNLSMGEFDSQQLAYLIYTSGSTGHPKGVMLSHRNACNLVEWAISEYGPKLFSRTLFSTSLNFDLSVYEIFSTLSCGGCLVIVENALSLLEKEYDLTLINTVPSALSALVDGKAIPSSVQVVNVAGEPLKKELAQRFFELTPIPSLCNLYAPSETTTYSTFVRMYRGQPFAPHIGKPLNNTQVYILDAQQKLLPPGVIGEIYIGGEGVAQGYINLAAMTEERFVSDPFANDGKAKMYKTGDLGRWTTDGNIEFLGRNDFQVKIRGFRIELGEIESTLLSHPAVDNAVVVAQEDVNGQPQLVAYYTLTKAVNVEQLIEFVSQPLADYMVPAAMVALDTMPLTQNGKVDRKALPAPNASAFVSTQYVEPKGENEQRLASIWQQLIGIEKISRNDNFFQIGGHSLLAARLISRLRSEFGTELSLAQIFNHPTLKAMAKILVQSSVVSQLPDIVPTHEGDTYPLTFAQKGLWLLEQLDGSSLVAYVMKNSVEFHGPLDFSALEVAFLTVIERHAPLRTKFISVDGQPLQQVMPAPDSFVIQRDGEFVVEFDLNEGYLIRAHIAEQDPNTHTLTIAMHHIISDGWSTRIILNELIAAYNSELSGAPLDLDSLPIQYGDYARWQQTHYQGEWYENQKSYWFEQLEGIPECVSLPLDFVRPEQQNYAGLTFPITIDHELTQNIKALAQRHHSTLYMTLLASFSLLIGRLSNQTDVVIGTPIAGRNRTELEDLVGMFVNTQALRVNLDQVTDVSSLIHQVKATVLKAQTNQDVSFEQIVEAVAPNRNMAHNPIYQVIFALHNTPNQLAQMQDVDVQVVMGDSDTAQFDLSVGLYEVDGQLSGYVNFATALFKQETVERFMACWHTLLSHMVQQDTLQPLALPMLPEQEQQRVVEDFNRGKQDFFSHVTITQRFEEQAERFADRIAVSYENNHLTYAQLNARANQLAHWLMANGVKPDSRVAIALERSEKLLIAILATLKAGGAYVPLDPNYPQERLQYSLQDSEPEVVITTSALVDKLGNLPVNTQLALLDKPEWLDLTIDNIAAECSGLTAQHMAYIIYTSGSTGKPKGVMVEHHNVMRLMAATQGDFQFNERDVWTLFHSYAFDFSVWEIWGALLFGGRLVVVPHLVSRAPDDFYQLLCNEQVTVLNQTPSAFRQLIAAQSEQPHDLRYVIFGGEALELSALSPWYQKSLNRHTQLINMYGITETTVHTTYYPLTAADVYRTGASPIGRGLNDLRLYILDEFRQPVPVGVTGELYVSGAGVARGYLNRAELTAERFMLDPFVADGQTRMYKSGDLGRWLDDGSIEYLGRNDDQVKIRGFRIELGEIEACVRSFDQVQDAAVIAAPNASGDYHIVAYYVSEPAQSAFDLEALRAHVADLVPNYMVPSAWMQLDVMPLTGNGKLDRRALPEVTTQDVVRHAYQAPQTDNEMLLASLWSELLGVEQIGRQDNFFELGGHSLLAVQLMAMLREHHCDIAVKHLFNQPDLASLAATMDPSEDSHVVIEENRIPQGCDSITPEMLPLANLSQESIDGICAQVSGGASNVQDIYPLAPLQEGILFHHLVQEQGDAYLTRFITGFSTESQLDAFLSGLQAVINRHDILRTAVAWQGLNQPMQVVWREAKMPIQTLSFDQQSQATGESVAECFQRHFDPATTRIELSAAPLIHAYRVYDQQEQRWLLCLLIHHLINDHTTLELLVEEVFAHIDGRTDQLLEPVPFRQFIGQIERRRDADREREYFTAQLADIDEPCAPFGLLNVQNSAQDIEQSTTYIDSASAVQLRQLAKQHNVSTASMFHLAWSMVLRAATGRHDVVFGTVLFGRMGAGINSDRTLGMFLNTVPLRLTLADQSASQLVAMTHQALAELLDYEHASLIMTQQCSGVAAQTPLFTSLLNYRYQGGSDAQAKILDRIDLVFSAEQTNYPISLDINDHASGEFSFDLHVDRTIGCERVAIMLNNAIEQLVDALANSSENSFNPSILAVAERTQVLEGFNQTERDYPTDTCIHHRIEQTAAHYANDIAVVDEDKQLTFAEFNAQANQLAHWLVQQGVTPDSRVGVSLDRSCELVVALVAILKAGGAYVPMDPGYPEDRLEYMVQDSRPVVLLTTSELRPRLGQVPSDVQIAYFERALPWANEAATNLDSASLGLSARSLAYLIYTSGSTGKPKGVMNEHCGVVNRLSWMAEDYGFSRDDVILQKTPFSFDVSVWEFFCPLWVGATLVMAKPEGHKDPQYLRELIERRQVSILHFVPPMLQMFLEGCEADDCPSLRLMFCSGEALPAETIRRTYQMLPHIELHNLYGPTEAAVDVTQWHCPRNLAGDRVSIGSSVANTRMYVLDAQGQPAPVGVAGEIFIGGIQVARGYLNRDDLTAERFVRDPFVAEGAMYKTGDVGRWLPDGTIEYQGRNDDQVKIRGFRVELGEISSALKGCQAVLEAVVIAKGSSANKRLIGYFTSESDLSIEALKAEMGERLPEYMVPAALVQIAEIPLTPNGKMDRKALPEPSDDAFVRRDYVAPQGEVENELATIWQTLLDTAQVGRFDNFFSWADTHC